MCGLNDNVAGGLVAVYLSVCDCVRDSLDGSQLRVNVPSISGNCQAINTVACNGIILLFV